ncbi:hypothetical protein KP509_18G081400 [Ceratopteris richardii]|uniref:Uncharacterized protein n=1 Tax=Ceratopteris richardii TaxID=49495 RepID=A0A8T2STA2_CERRI|nr:hypothetical protein KP509_18G081400 [Ceratopteris richardii]
MMSAGETVALQGNSFGIGGGFGGLGNMMQGVMLPPAFMSSLPSMPFHNDNTFSTSAVSLAPSSDAEEKIPDCHMGENELLAKHKEDESDSKSSSDNLEGVSGEDNEGADIIPSKKRYHRHTLRQIQEMERFFKECPHPDEKQRQELSRELNLSPRQIKFWFQNKRTKLKVHHERQDNGVLRAENEKLKLENFALRDAVRNVSCPSCGGPATLAEMSYDEQQLRIENMRLREEIDRISAMAAKYIGRQIPPMPMSSACPSAASSDVEKPLVMELAVASMEELYQVAEAGEPLWIMGSNGVEVIQHDIYLHRFPRGIGPTPAGLRSETSRYTGLVPMNPSSLVEALMDMNQWAEMFPAMVSRVQTVEVLSIGIAGTYDGAIQLMFAEFHVPSPLVPTRESYFLRYSKRVDHTWVVVDVSIDSLHGNMSLRCRRRPSGCIIEEMSSGYSKVTWVEHIEADPRGVHGIFQHYVNSGLAYGAVRWICSLQRHCERMAAVLANNVPFGEMNVFPGAEGRSGMLKLAERMTNSFCGGVSASKAHTWVTLAGNSGADDIQVLIRKSMNDPGRPPGIVLSAATSLWLSLPPLRVFNFLRNERFRTQWDILSNSGVVEVFHVAKGQVAGNSVSLLRVNPTNSTSNNMLILQECCTDESCSLVVYAPVDLTAMSTVLKGGDPDAVALLPSGFAVLPDGSQSGSSVNVGGARLKEVVSGGSLLTVTFQILVDHVPTARLSLGSVAKVNNLISNTVVYIKEALSKLSEDAVV